MKTIDTLIEDIYGLITNGSLDIPKESYEQLGKAVADAVQGQLRKAVETIESVEKPKLRMSNIGKPDKYLWYLMRHQNDPSSPKNSAKEVYSASKIFSFMYGAVLEEILLWLAVQSGHEVTERQQEVVVEGVVGHKDCRIDGVGVDAKSASNQSFQKFKSRKLPGNDPFGYMHQIGGYFPGEDRAGFLVANKETGELALSMYDKEEIPDTPERIRHLKELAKQDTAPPRCYEPKLQGRNKALPIGCKSCPFKMECWKEANGGKGLRAFMYSEGPEWLVEINSEPKVNEVDPTNPSKVLKLNAVSEEESFKDYTGRSSSPTPSV